MAGFAANKRKEDILIARGVLSASAATAASAAATIQPSGLDRRVETIVNHLSNNDVIDVDAGDDEFADDDDEENEIPARAGGKQKLAMNEKLSGLAFAIGSNPENFADGKLRRELCKGLIHSTDINVGGGIGKPKTITITQARANLRASFPTAKAQSNASMGEYHGAVINGLSGDYVPLDSNFLRNNNRSTGN